MASLGPVTDERLRREPHNAALWLAAGQKAEKGPLPNLDRASSRYAGALREDPGNRQGIAAKAGLARARIEARRAAQRNDGTLLLGVAEQFPGSPEALESLRGLLLLAADNRPGGPSIGTAAQASCRELARQSDLEGLHRVAGVLDRLGLSTTATDCERLLPRGKGAPGSAPQAGEEDFALAAEDPLQAPGTHSPAPGPALASALANVMESPEVKSASQALLRQARRDPARFAHRACALKKGRPRPLDWGARPPREVSAEALTS